MNELRRRRVSLALTAALLLLGGCVTSGGGTASSADTKPAPAPAPVAVGPGMNERGEVIDSSKVEGGYGQRVKGLNDWEGEITGKPGPGSKFTQLQIGMGMRQVMDIAGPPTDRGSYITGKRFIPFYHGSDKRRFELAYKGQGRLVFASPGGFETGVGNLIWIIHNPNDTGYR